MQMTSFVSFALASEVSVATGAITVNNNIDHDALHTHKLLSIWYRIVNTDHLVQHTKANQYSPGGEFSCSFVVNCT